MSNTALALAPKESNTAIAPRNLDELMNLGDVFAKSGYFSDARQAAQAVVKIITGQELGISPMQAMMGIHIVQGKPMISGDLLAKKVKASGRYDYKVLQLDDTACKLEFFENGQSIGVSSFTIEDARRAKTQNLDKFPRNMLFNRAVSNGVKWYCPDVTTLTVYTPGEIADEEEPRNVTPQPAPVEQLPIPKAEKAAESSPDDAHAALVAELKIKAKNAGFSKAKELIAFIAKLLNCEECQASRFTEWLNTKKPGELEFVIAALEERAIDPVDDTAEAESVNAAPSPHEALAVARAEWLRLGGKEHSILREMDKRFSVGVYAELSDEQATELLQWLQKCILDVGVS